MNIISEEQLPISIKLGNSLTTTFPKLVSICERLAAQLNFQTMTCGWFGDEDDILTIVFSVDISSQYDNQKCLYQAEADDENQFVSLSDDVCYSFKKQVNYLNVLIAITENELEFLKQNEKVLKKYTEKKLVKVINLVADKLTLTQIPT